MNSRFAIITLSCIAALLAGCGGGGGTSAPSGSGGTQTSDFGNVTAHVLGAYQPPVFIGSRNAVFTGVFGASFSNVQVRRPRIESLTTDEALGLTDIAVDYLGKPYFYNYGTGQLRSPTGINYYSIASSPSISGLGDRFAYLNYDPNKTLQIHTAKLDGSSDLRVTNSTLHASSPVFSPDGKSILYYRGGTGAGNRIYKVPATGGISVPLTSAQDSCVNPTWSPDGKQIAFFRRASGTTGYVPYTMTSDGANLALLVGGYASDSPGAASLSYVPNSTKLIETFYYGTNYILWFIDPINGGYNQSTSAAEISSVSVSPIGNLAVLRRGGTNQGIYLRNIVTGAERLLIPGAYSSPRWGPFVQAMTMVGPTGTLDTSCGGFLFGQTGSGLVTSFISVDATTRTSIRIAQQTTPNPSQSVAVCVISADNVTKLSFVNDFRDAVTTVATASSPIRGAVVAFSADSGRVISVVPFVQSAVAQKAGEYTYSGHFVGAYGKSGKTRDIASATELKLDPRTGEILSLR